MKRAVCEAIFVYFYSLLLVFAAVPDIMRKLDAVMNESKSNAAAV